MSKHVEDDLMSRIIDGLESTPQTTESAKETLAALGYDTDAELVKFKTRLKGLIHKHTWRESAEVKSQKFNQKLKNTRDWNDKSDKEIDEIFNAARSEDYALAARNLEYITRDEKIAILEDKELLDGRKEIDS